MEKLFKNYQIETRFYDKSVECILYLPEDILLLKNNDSGTHVCYEGFCSLIGWIKADSIDIDKFYELNNNLHIIHYEFNDYLLFHIEHIKFIKFERPDFVESKVFMEKTRLNHYYLVHKDKDKLDDKLHDLIKNGENLTNKQLKKYIIRGEIYRIDKILNINGINDIEVYTVEKDNISVYHTDIFSLLENSFNDNDKQMVISTTAYVKFIQMQNQILSKINHHIKLN
jgi:hypothetical protein